MVVLVPERAAEAVDAGLARRPVEGQAVTLEPHENSLVADFVMQGDAPKLIELNPLSTSGFYTALHVDRMLADLGAILAA